MLENFRLLLFVVIIIRLLLFIIILYQLRRFLSQFGFHNLLNVFKIHRASHNLLLLIKCLFVCYHSLILLLLRPSVRL